jgi:hypothetical protein
MKYINWDIDKNLLLKESRGIGFEDVILHIANGDVLDEYRHPNQQKYENQRILVIRINDYAYLVPYVENEDELFLKTIIPSRKATEKYIGERTT